MTTSIFAPILKTRSARNLGLFFVSLWLLAALALLALPLFPWWLFLVFMATTIISLVFAQFPKLIIYLMAVFYPFIGWYVVVGQINAPLIDFIGLFGVTGFVLRILIFSITDRTKITAWHWWGLLFFTAFGTVSLISALLTDIVPVLSSLYYVVRTIIFFYFAFVFVPLNILKNKNFLNRIFWIIYTLGIGISFYALFGFLQGILSSALPNRALPLPIFGISPFGQNHNLIAEMMLVTVPIGLYLLSLAKDKFAQKLLFAGIILMAVANLFTFSRTGWLALFLQLFLFLVLQYRGHFQRVFRYVLLLFIVLLPLALYMFYFSFFSNIVLSSNQSRLFLNEVTWDMFMENPIFGSGPNTFMARLAQNPIYVMEFGEPLDAHGFLQKTFSETGILGMLSFVALLVYVIYTVGRIYLQARHSKNYQLSFLVLTMLLLVSGSIFAELFQPNYYSPKLWFPLGVALAAVFFAQEKLKEKNP